MKVVSITDVRQDGTRVIRETQQSGEATLIVIKSRPAAYLVGAQQYEALLAENQRLRREALEHEVEIAIDELRRGEAREFASAADLMADIEAEIAAESRVGAPAPATVLPSSGEATVRAAAPGHRTRPRAARGQSR